MGGWEPLLTLPLSSEKVTDLHRHQWIESSATGRKRVVVAVNLLRPSMNPDQVIAEAIEDAGDLDRALGITRRRIEEETELQIVAIVGHVYPQNSP
jgi:hypothetical protein